VIGVVASPAFDRIVRPGPLDVYFGGHRGPDLDRVESAFFSGLQLDNGTFKTTSAARLDQINSLVARFLPRDRVVDVLDVGVSSGVTTADWSAQLRSDGIEHQIVATDLVMHARLLTLGRRIAVLWQQNGHPLAVQVGPVTLYLGYAGDSGPRGLLSRVLGPALSRLHAAIVNRRRWPHEAPPRPWRAGVRSVDLVSRHLVADASIRLVEDDVSFPREFGQSFDVCRAANLLNRAYFPDNTLAAMAINLVARLRDGGLLVVCRTTDGDDGPINQATVFRRSGPRLEVAERLNGGSEVEELLLSTDIPGVVPEHASPLTTSG
jgi:hypothetical protein